MKLSFDPSVCGLRWREFRTESQWNTYLADCVKNKDVPRDQTPIRFPVIMVYDNLKAKATNAAGTEWELANFFIYDYAFKEN